ncbi:hypothetical protein BH10ACI2_BH10ACI2_07990 [soil metagenome]
MLAPSRWLQGNACRAEDLFCDFCLAGSVKLVPIQSNMFKKFGFIVVLALFAGVFTVLAQDEKAIETIRIDTRLVSVPVIVSDRNGRYVPNLTAGNFTVMHDGAKQNIDFFAATEEPLTIALLIDTSQSTRPVLGDIKDSAKSFLKLLTPKDRAMIVSFDYDIHMLSQLTGDQEQLKKAVKNAEIPKMMFGTLLRDAAFETVNRSFAGIRGRKAIIILTDGKDAGSRITSRELLHSLEESDTLIYTIMFKTGERQPVARVLGGGRNGGIFGGGFPSGRGRGGGGRLPGRMPPPQQKRPDNPRRDQRVEEKNEDAAVFLQKLSDTTAGRFYPSKEGKLKTIFAEIVDELRFQYRLGFYPPDETGQKAFHELKIKVDRPETVVRARSGYRTQAKSN